ncbi:MAG: lycopene cyclase family protein [Chloroflexi bacterium]|nr:lycopene cyclase family protein [Chloroflexota bacterium]
MPSKPFDALIIGAGPGGVALAAALGDLGLTVGGLTPDDPATPWINTFGIWRDELDAPGLSPDWLSHQWQDCTVYANGREIPLHRIYGLLNNNTVQAHFLNRSQQAGMHWFRGRAAELSHTPTHSQVTLADGRAVNARLVIDASGHHPVFVQRPYKPDVAMQAAYGIVGRFSRPPVRRQQMVLMDFRSNHLSPTEKEAPPTFLYAMDLGDDLYFVEETSLASYPAVAYDVLQRRLEQRLAHRGIAVTEVQHVEHCLFPMNLPMPYLNQPVMGYGGAASLVHPASGYQVGAAMRYAPELAQVIATALDAPRSTPGDVAQAAWHALWPVDRIRRHNIYLYGLATLLRFNDKQIQHFFAAFFDMPQPQWAGYLSNSLNTNEVLQAMLGLFVQTSNPVRRSLLSGVGSAGGLLWHALRGQPA